MIDTLFSSLPRYIFIGSWFYSILEFILSQFLVIDILRTGIPFRKETIVINNIAEFQKLENSTFKREEGKFQFDKNKVYFLSRFYWLTFFRINTPFPVRGTAELHESGKLEFVGLLPIGTSIFFGAFTTVWVIAVVSEFIQGNLLEATIAGLIGGAFLALFGFISYKIEISRWQKMSNELVEILEENDINYLGHA